MRVLLTFISFVVAGCTSDPRDPAFPSVDANVQALGLRLSFDLVDGGYTVFAVDANDETIAKAVAQLRKLRQGTSLTELDYERRFSFFLGGTAITDKAIEGILSLEVTQVRLNGTKVTPESLRLLQQEEHLKVLVIGKDQFSKDELQSFTESRPNVVVMYAE